MRDILEILFKRRKAILLILALCVATSIVGNYILPRMYESEAKLLISVGREATLPTTVMTQPLNVFLERDQQVNTQLQLLKNRFLVEETLNILPADWETLNMPPQSIFGKITGYAKSAVGSVRNGIRWCFQAVGLLPKVTPEQRKILTLLRLINVERFKDTDVVSITFRHPNPGAAQVFLEAYLQTYYMVMDTRTNKSSTALDFFSKEADEIKEELNKAENELSEFRDQANIYDLAQQKKSTSEEMAALYTQITKNNLQLEGLEQDKRKYSGAQGEQIEAAIPVALRNDQVIIETLKTLVANKMRLTKELKKLGENNPKILILQAELEGIRNSLKEEILNTMGSQIISLKSENNDLNKQLEALQQRAQELDKQGIGMEQLQRKVDLLRKSYITYSEKQETSRINTMLDMAAINSVAVAQPPTMPILPVSPKRMLNLLLGVVAGLVLGFFYAMLMEKLGANINSPHEMGKMLETKNQVYLPPDPPEGLKEDLPAHSNNALQLLASMALHTKDAPPRILMAVGASLGVGTSSVILKFAKFLAKRLGQRVLLVDANFIDKKLSKTSRLDSAPGLTDVLAGTIEVDKAVTTISETLYLLPTGKEALLPATLLSITKDMRQSLLDLLTKYDIILFDASPLSGSESFNLAKSVDGIIVVAQAEKTRRAVLRVTKEQLEQVNARVVGSVLNQRKFHIPNWLYRYL